MTIQLPKETEMEKKEIVRIERPEIFYIPTKENELPQETNHSRALATRDLSSPTTKESVLTMSKMDRRAILTGNFLVAFQKRINQLRGNPNGLIKPLYPYMSFFSDIKQNIDLQSVGDGTARMELTSVLSVPEMGFGGMNQRGQVFENIRRNYVHELPEHLEQPQQKKGWLSRRPKNNEY
jgi:hypothetical protein